MFSAKQFRVGYGHIKAREVVRLTATSALIHSHFNAKTLENDLAIITLPQNQLINVQIVKPIAIARAAVELKNEGSVFSFGFESDSATTISEDLMIARQIVIDNQACADAFSRPVHANQFCAQDPKVPPPAPPAPPAPAPEGETSGEAAASPEENASAEASPDAEADADETNTDDWANGWSRRSMGRVAADAKKQTAVCRGDTGSAIVRRTEAGAIIGFGIVSRVPQGCNAEKPALYTLLPAFVQWLEDATLGEVQIV